jgi:hypothetical protein
LPEELPVLPANIDPELFLKWRDTRRGTSHAQRMTNPVWQWLVRTRLDAYSASAEVTGAELCPGVPRWCCQRMGQTETRLPDGRTLLVAGEHEDHYDPDFYIYNDVIVLGSDDSIDIYGYPEEDFPPTDFHTASLVAGDLVLVGNLGYPRQRVAGTTQVLVLDPQTLRVRQIRSVGQLPGWISQHTAEVAGTDLVIRGGTFFDEPVCENIDDWKLDTRSWRWQRLTDRQWTRVRFSRADGSPHELWRIGQSLAFPAIDEQIRQQGLGHLLPPVSSRADATACRQRYHPDLPHQPLPEDEDEYGVYRIRVGETVIRYNEDTMDVTMTVEGRLDEQTLQVLIDDLQDKLSRSEACPWTHLRIPGR